MSGATRISGLQDYLPRNTYSNGSEDMHATIIMQKNCISQVPVFYRGVLFPVISSSTPSVEAGVPA